MKIVQLPGTLPADSRTEPCGEVIRRLEELLKEAKSGELRGLIYGKVMSGQDVSGEWVSDGHCWNDMLVAADDALSAIRRARAAFSNDRGSMF